MMSAVETWKSVVRRSLGG